MKKTILFVSALALAAFAYAGEAKDKAACTKEKSCCCCAKACPDKKAGCDKAAKEGCTRDAKPACKKSCDAAKG